MKTPTAIAVSLAVIVALAFLFLGSSIFTPFQSTDSQTEIAMQETNQPVTELTITDQTVGTGATAQAGDTVTVQYVGQLQDGSIFDASRNHGTAGFTFVLGAGEVIKGWDDGVVGMQEGGVRRLAIPAELGYGAQTVGPIPANSTLYFDVELVKVQKAQ